APPLGADAPGEDVARVVAAPLLPRIGVRELGEELAKLLAHLLDGELRVRVGELPPINDEDAGHEEPPWGIHLAEQGELVGRGRGRRRVGRRRRAGWRQGRRGLWLGRRGGPPTPRRAVWGRRRSTTAGRPSLHRNGRRVARLELPAPLRLGQQARDFV